jgi:hypothetical protein
VPDQADVAATGVGFAFGVSRVQKIEVPNQGAPIRQKGRVRDVVCIEGFARHFQFCRRIPPQPIPRAIGVRAQARDERSMSFACCQQMPDVVDRKQLRVLEPPAARRAKAFPSGCIKASRDSELRGLVFLPHEKRHAGLRIFCQSTAGGGDPHQEADAHAQRRSALATRRGV